MKIIQVSTFFYPSVGGVERQAQEIASHLANSGDSVEVFTTDATHGTNSMQRLNQEFPGYKVRRFKHLFGFGYFFRFSPALIYHLCKAEFDVMHVHNIHDAHLIPAILIKLFRKKKLVVTGHNPYIVSSEKRGGFLHQLVKVFDLVVKLLGFGIDHYIALLQSEKQTVQTKFGWKDEKVSVIPNGIQDLFYTETGNPDRFYQEYNIDRSRWDLIVGGASRINYVKGFQNLKQAVDQLPRILFVFAGGDGGYLDSLRKLYSGNRNVLITGKYLSSEQVRDFYQAIDIFVLPSIYEPFGMTLVEAMAQGKYVMATTEGGPREIIDDKSGELIPPNDQQLWKRRISYFLNHSDELRSAVPHSKRLATKYQWVHIIKEIRQVYSKLLN